MLLSRTFPELRPLLSASEPFGTPSTIACDLSESPDAYHVEVEVPGFAKEDIKLNVQGTTLRITGEKKEKEKQGERSTISAEIYRPDQFSRSVRLPGHVDVGKIEAKLCEGILCICLPKVQESKAHSIDIK